MIVISLFISLWLSFIIYKLTGSEEMFAISIIGLMLVFLL